MKTKFTYLLLLTTFICFSQKEHGTITLNNGSTITGLVKVTKSAFKFKESEDSEAVKYDFEKAKEATITDKKGIITKFEFVALKEGKQPELLQIVEDGYMRLYSDSNTYFGSAAPGAGSSFRTTETYYVKRKNETVAQYYLAVGYIPKIGFKKVIETYFKDCLEIQQKVENKEFRSNDYIEVVKFYNSNCAPKP